MAVSEDIPITDRYQTLFILIRTLFQSYDYPLFKLRVELNVFYFKACQSVFFVLAGRLFDFPIKLLQKQTFESSSSGLFSNLVT